MHSRTLDFAWRMRPGWELWHPDLRNSRVPGSNLRQSAKEYWVDLGRSFREQAIPKQLRTITTGFVAGLPRFLYLKFRYSGRPRYTPANAQ